MRDEYFIDSLHPEARVQYLIEQKMPLNSGDVRFLISVSEKDNLRERLMRQLLQSDIEMSGNARAILLKHTGQWRHNPIEPLPHPYQCSD